MLTVGLSVAGICAFLWGRYQFERGVRCGRHQIDVSLARAILRHEIVITPGKS